MKRIVSVLLILIMTFTMFSTFVSADVEVVEQAEEYEFWAPSPYLTTSVGQEEFRIQKAMDMGKLLMYPLPELGNNYFFAIAELQLSNNGKNGRTNLSILYCYLLLATDDSYIILDFCSPWSDYSWNAGANIDNVSDITVEPSKGSRLMYIIKPNAKYEVSGWDDYNDYMFITEEKRMIIVSEDDSKNQGGWPVIHNGKPYWANEWYYNGSGTYRYYSNGIEATILKEMYFSGKNTEYGSSVGPATTDVNVGNGYTSYKTVTVDTPVISAYKIPGSDNLYFRFTNYPIYDEAGTVITYYDDIEILENDRGNFTTVKTYSFDTNSRYQTGNTITQLAGVNVNKYREEGLSAPVVDVGKKYIITNTGQVAMVELNGSTHLNWNYALYNGKLVVIRCQNGNTYVYESTSYGTVYKQMLNYVNISSKDKFVVSEDIILDQVSNGNEGQDGYYYNASRFQACSSFKTMSLSSPKEWSGRFIDNVFDNGRKVECYWSYVGNYSEMWYTITDTDGRVVAKGPTGYTVDSTKAEKDCFCIAVGNSKFIAGVKDLQTPAAKEYYRASVVKETGDGNVVSSVAIGNKVLTPPADTDTVPVQDVIDFGKDNLPIGYNIKDNVIGTNKLDSNVREKINAIRLNDIVIIKNTETASGTQNTGTTLEAFEEYDSTIGDAAVSVYTNGQNFCWYCSDISGLNTGTYNRYYTVGDKVIYVTYKIVDAPDNKGVTTVVF
ncbi:MAG: hypothetical protein KIG65_01190 [Eubacteriales bacterium]|nr:hypothetical protein [Eubacteriales bacterium]